MRFLYIIFIFTFSFFAHTQNKSMMERLNTEVGVEFPTEFGVHGKFSMNQNKNLYLRLGMGCATESTLDNNLTITKEKKALMVDSLSNSLYSDIRLGYRASDQQGIYGELGYSYMFSGKGEVSVDRLRQAIGRSDLPNHQLPYQVQSNVQSATLHGGYRIPVMSRLGLTAEIGLIKPISSTVRVDYSQHLPSAEENKDSKKVQDILKGSVVWKGSVWLSYVL